MIVCILFTISMIASIKYDHISEFNVNGQFWNGEAVVDFLCANDNNENDIFNDDPKYIGNYLKTRIGSIRFQNCRFREIQRKFGIEFIHLHTFNISGVELESVQMKTLKGAKKLITLIASNNRLTEIPAHVFTDAQQLATIDFSNNAIQHIDALSFEGAISLTTLNLSQNRIDQRDLKLISIPSLLILDLSLNSLNNLSGEAFSNLPNLMHLNLRQANITRIAMKTFIHQRRLISLDLSGNHLVQLNINLFHPTANNNLRSLSLDNNQLTELHCIRNSTLSEFVFLDLNKNNFNCSYLKQFMDFVHWQRSSHRHNHSQSTNENGHNVNGIMCKISNDSTAAKNSNFQIEFCPAIDESNRNNIKLHGFSYLHATLIFFCVCVLAVAPVVYKQFGSRFRSTDLMWRNSGSTVQIIINE